MLRRMSEEVKLRPAFRCRDATANRTKVDYHAWHAVYESLNSRPHRVLQIGVLIPLRDACGKRVEARGFADHARR